MILDFREMLGTYLLPIIIGVLVLFAVFATLALVSRLGREERDDPAGRAISRRRRRD